MESSAVVSSLMPADDSAAQLRQFATHGWVRIPGAFSAGEAAAMREVVWARWKGPASGGTIPQPGKSSGRRILQHLKSDPAFRAVGSARTIEAIDRMLEGQTWRMPGDYGNPINVV